MQKLRAIYCRVFQTVCKLCMPFLPYRIPKIISNVKRIPGVLQQYGLDNVLIVTDPGIKKSGLTDQLTKTLEDHDISYEMYDKTISDPTTRTVEEAADLYRLGGCEAIIGFGGGSSIDCAKAVGIRIARPHTPLSKMKGILKVHARLPLLIAIPTTAGTGSETTLAAVITDAGTSQKCTIDDFSLIPRFAVLDPKMTVSLPKGLTSTTGMDALTHAVEAYIGNSTTPASRGDAKEAVSLIYENLKKAYDDGENLNARQNMSNAAFLAGLAFTKSYVGYVHAVAHSIGGAYHVPHGLAVAIILPMVLEAYGSKIHDKLKDLAIAARLADEDTPAWEAAGRFIDSIKHMKRHFGIGDTIPEIRKEDIPKLAREADKEANPLYPVPVLMDAKELERFYYQLMPEKKG